MGKGALFYWEQGKPGSHKSERELTEGGVHSGKPLLSSRSFDPGQRVTLAQWHMRKVQDPLVYAHCL